jgi:hypothetical protein
LNYFQLFSYIPETIFSSNIWALVRDRFEDPLALKPPGAVRATAKTKAMHWGLLRENDWQALAQAVTGVE